MQPHSLRLIFIALSLLLASCKGTIHMQGHVYDKTTKQPLDHAEVIMILGRGDTVRRYTEHDRDGQPNPLSGNYLPSYTDSNGYFSVSKCIKGRFPECRLVIIKDGYVPVVITRKSLINPDNVQMEKATLK